MTLIKWKDSYSIGIDAIDHEHRELIDLINGLHANLERGGDHSAVTVFLGEIFRAISAHFALEEQFMREYRYDQTAEHKSAHEALLEEIRDIMDGYEADPDKASRRLASELDSWFSVHFQTHDARLHRSLGPHPH
jgi:hemerythrin